jgi:membrane fusion protein, multidrug efflux system
MKKRMIIMLALVVLFLAIIGLWKVKQVRAAIELGKQFAPPPAAVTTAIVKRELWQPALKVVGSLKAVNGVTVSTDLPGIISQIAFESGTSVHKGDLLVRFDSQQEEAQLRVAEARRDLARLNLDRNRDLVASGAISKSEFDTADSEHRQAVAAVDEARALIARKNITAPFDGRLGIRQVDLGQYLNVGAPIVQLESVHPIHVEFAIPQQNLSEVAVGKQLRLKAAGLAGEEFAGTVTAIESRLDAATRNVMVQGTVDNSASKLRPGMFANVEVLLPEQEVLSIPASAIGYAPYGDSVFVVKKQPASSGPGGLVVEEHFVKLGTTRGDRVAIVSGIKDGDEVVTSGAFKLRNGVPVQVNNSVQPSGDTEPNPPNT